LEIIYTVLRFAYLFNWEFASFISLDIKRSASFRLKNVAIHFNEALDDLTNRARPVLNRFFCSRKLLLRENLKKISENTQIYLEV
jgi:hypothetical protein